jgi:hypothetical protein
MKLNLKVPTSWADITIKQFCEWNYLAENCGGKLNNLEDILNALVILLDTDKENLRKLNSKQISKLLESLEFLVKPIPNLPLEKTIVIHGVTYACDLDMRSFSTGQYIDLTDILKDKDNLKNRINEVLACLFIPLGKEYGSYDIEEVKEIFYENISIQHAHNVSDFFLLLSTNLQFNIQKYLKEKQKVRLKEIDKQIRDLIASI